MAGHEPMITARTGLLLDPYFSGTKVKCLLDHTPGARALAEAGKLAFGTVDSFLIWKLTWGRVPVSYTHLDVYKRQHHGWFKR